MKNSFLIYGLIIFGGILQAFINPMNAALKSACLNPWLASLISYIPIVACLVIVWFCQPVPIPKLAALNVMPWWAPLGGIIGTVAVILGLLFVKQVGAGTFAALCLSANILTTMVIDHFGLMGLEPHPVTWVRMLGSASLVTGVVLISLF